MTIKYLFSGAFALAAFIMVQPGTARADDYCREYTRTVYIGGQTQDAYGTACLQPDGSWMIVGEGLGNDIADNASNVTYVVHDDRRDIVPPRVVYYERPIVQSRYRPSPVFVWYNNNDRGYYKRGQYVPYSRYANYGWSNRWDDDHNHGYGQGRSRDRR